MPLNLNFFSSTFHPFHATSIGQLLRWLRKDDFASSLCIRINFGQIPLASYCVAYLDKYISRLVFSIHLLRLTFRLRFS